MLRHYASMSFGGRGKDFRRSALLVAVTSHDAASGKRMEEREATCLIQWCIVQVVCDVERNMIFLFIVLLWCRCSIFWCLFFFTMILSTLLVRWVRRRDQITVHNVHCLKLCLSREEDVILFERTDSDCIYLCSPAHRELIALLLHSLIAGWFLSEWRNKWLIEELIDQSINQSINQFSFIWWKS